MLLKINLNSKDGKAKSRRRIRPDFLVFIWLVRYILETFKTGQT